MNKQHHPEKRDMTDVLRTPELPTYAFAAGEVGELLAMEKWRLQKFVGGKRYQLSPKGGLLGKGQGSRRMFRLQDVYRLAIADQLVRDGFAPQFVSRALQEIEDHELLQLGPEGRAEPPIVGFVRGVEGPRMQILQAGAQPATGTGEPYYVLDLPVLIKRVDQRIYARTNKGASR